MKRFNDEVYGILNAAEAHGMIGGSATANKILAAAKKYYQSVSESDKKEIEEKLIALGKEPGIGLPVNYMQFVK
ncbi:hypothetical protein [Morganella morganii]|uniref:hypothetical protein n=1 Tax=Morganella morganii TaxID=582 RepID=UPI002809C16E|nr:hypothetical protein SUGSMm_09390 [Morganella morganii subsp. sibonii]HDU8307903.1 hypothetical protein [Morganella morganii subsp. sibonii]